MHQFEEQPLIAPSLMNAVQRRGVVLPLNQVGVVALLGCRRLHEVDAHTRG